MDENKRKKLKELGYEIVKTCALCEFGHFPHSAWGTCLKRKHMYKHEKHTDSKREMSINKSGVCSDFEASERKTNDLGKFTEFMGG